MPIDLNFYLNINKQWILIKSDTLDRVPNIGEKVELHINNQYAIYLVVDVEHRVGRNANIFLRASTSLIKNYTV